MIIIIYKIFTVFTDSYAQETKLGNVVYMFKLTK